MSSFGLHRRVAALVLAAAFASMAAKGLCFMPMGKGEAKGAHDCCKKGWRTAPPACCMDAETDVTAVVLVAKQITSAPALDPTYSVQGFVLFDASAGPLTRPDRNHSPPATAVLRI